MWVHLKKLANIIKYWSGQFCLLHKILFLSLEMFPYSHLEVAHLHTNIRVLRLTFISYCHEVWSWKECAIVLHATGYTLMKVVYYLKISYPYVISRQWNFASVPNPNSDVAVGQSSWLQIQKSRVRFLALPDFLRSSGSGLRSTQPREYRWGATWKK
jgi:hypothetical protein